VKRLTLALAALLVVVTLGLAFAQTPAPAPAAAPPAASDTPAAAPASKIDKGDTAWILTSAALVLMMTAPGLALFYGGMVRQKNALATLMQSFIIMAVISIQWVLWGYSLAFGPDKGGIIGGLDYLGLRGVGGEPFDTYAATIPHQAFMLFQMMFAIITPALITGAFAERKKFSAFLLFTVLWATFVYDPLAHWVWGAGGWLKNLGALDFAGGTVVHISSGVSALVCAIVLGRRKGYGHQPMQPHNLPLTVIGAALLWVGWFGFNAGSALEASSLAVAAFVSTNTAAAAAALGRGGGARGHHAGGRLRGPGVVDRHRRPGRGPLLHRLQPQVEARVRRLAGRRGRPRRGRHLGGDRDRPVRLQGGERGGRRRPLLRQSGPGVDADRRGAGDLRNGDRRYLGDPQGGGRDRRAAGER
jgi:hypothetical protein